VDHQLAGPTSSAGSASRRAWSPARTGGSSR
jgi:hypothetical protein